MATLDAAITDAVKTEDAKAPEAEVKEEKVEKTETAEETEVETAAGEGDLTDNEKANALQLFRSLKDPATAAVVVKFMAEQHGYVPKPVTSERQAEKEVNKIHAVLSKHLGPELDWLVEKMGPAIEEIVGDQVVEKTKDLRQSADKIDLERYEAQSEKALIDLAREAYKDPDINAIPDNVMKKMTELMDEIPPNANMTMKRYMQILHNSAISELGVAKVTSRATADKMTKNRNDAPSRLASERTSEATIIPGSTKMTLDSAIKKAMEAVNEDMKK